jgi:hypothetical protein
MSASKQLQLAGTPGGRVLLHLVALQRDHRWSWHLSGIIRELSLSGKTALI